MSGLYNKDHRDLKSNGSEHSNSYYSSGNIMALSTVEIYFATLLLKASYKSDTLLTVIQTSIIIIPMLACSQKQLN